MTAPPARKPPATKKRGPDGFTDKERMFVREYLVDLHQTNAAIRAGYEPGSAKNRGSILMSKPHIKAAVAEGIAKRAAKIEVTADKVVQELAKLAFANIKNYIRIGTDGRAYLDLKQLTDDQAAAIAEITSDVTGSGRRKNAVTKLKLADKKAALDSLARHLGMFTDKIDMGVDQKTELRIKFV